jgi:hypothetical protein
MKMIDIHSHWGTRRGYTLRTEEELAQQKKTWNSEPAYATEDEMADYFRRSSVRAVLDFGFTKFIPLSEAKRVHDYGFETQRAHPDVIPALIFVGTTGLGAGLPGGNGILLDDCHPRHLDYVAAKFPQLTVVAARPGWPWQTETIAVLMHKRNIWYDLHGWSPKYFAPDLKHEIPRRLRERVMFGADYPLFTYERLVRDWRNEGYAEDVLDDVFHDNAERFLEQVRRT